VTGGAGFIGSHLVDRLLEKGFEVTVFDDLSTGQAENIVAYKSRKGFHLVKGDIRNFEAIRKAVKDIDLVFHEAALVSVVRSVENPILTNEVNVAGSLNLLKACLDAGVKRLIYASSSAVYGESQTLPRREDSPPQPISPYAVSKLTAENYVNVFHKVYGLESVCLRYFNVYGPRQAYGPYTGVITLFINRIMDNKPPIIYGDGEQTRDFTNVQDVVEANFSAIMNTRATGEVLNVATGRATSVNELASTLLRVMGKPNLKPIYQSPRPGDVKQSYADISKARQILDYEPKVGLKEGLKELVDWYTVHRSSFTHSNV